MSTCVWFRAKKSERSEHRYEKYFSLYNSICNDRLGPRVVVMLGLLGGFNPIEKY